MNGRTQWIDWAKTIGIWLVVFGHIPGNHLAVSEFIYAFHMPLFFFISGYLAKSRSVVETARSGVVRLLIPYAMFYVLTWLWWYFFGFLRHPEWFSHLPAFQAALVQPLFGMLFGAGYGTSLSNMINVPLWFLVGLFNVSVAFSVVDALKSWPMKFMCAALLSGIPYVLTSRGIDLLFSLDSALMALPFYVGGKYAAEAGLVERCAPAWADKKTEGYLRPLVIALSFAAVGLVAAANGRVDINHVSYGKHPLLFYFGGLAGIVLVWAVSECCARWIYGPTVFTISRGAIVILALHAIVTSLFLALLRTLGVDQGLLLNAAISAAVVIICVPVIEFVESEAPRLMGNRKAAPG
ncbi:acyltransferase family protein [Sphaerotilus sp.]|uniref:acyltransferase family protein n=1 Tax=Sphaerotilus sp. TaxID=2093942 RepID=UPI002ACDEC17|nr:acyltransferase family protein [Sphaerotilus sp.]MDZ7857361.1 acyltransferase family protein [Sphaerotilus sp.]